MLVLLVLALLVLPARGEDVTDSSTSPQFTSSTTITSSTSTTSTQYPSSTTSASTHTTPIPVCGRPGRPVNGTVSPEGSSLGHSAGDTVSYSCVEGFVLYGEQSRTCQNNGSWDKEIPLCDFNISAGKRSLQSGTLWSYTPDLAVDGSPETCSFTPRGPDPRWWQVHLGHKFNVIRVSVTISPGSVQEFTIFVIELLADNKALYKPCTTFKGVFKTHKADFLCNDGVGHPGQFVYIRDDRKEEEYFGLCEVQVFAFRERIPCGSPEVPIHGQVSITGGRKAHYTCNPGYSLMGDEVHTCSTRGKWEGQTVRCNGVRCPELSPPIDGTVNIHSVNGRADIGPGSLASYSCRSGFSLSGNRTRECLPQGVWGQTAPYCRKVTCGSPPAIPNARYTLLNASDVHRGIAVYTCMAGYRLLNSSSDMVSTCLDSGSWKRINISCVSLLTSGQYWDDRTGSGRSLNYDVDLISTSVTSFNANGKLKTEPKAVDSSVVAALATIAAVLLLALLILLTVVVVRRQHLSGPGSFNPLLRGHVNKNFEANYNADNGSTIANIGREAHYNDSLNNGNRTPMYHHNIARINAECDNSSLSGSMRLNEPPYERVRTRSEHSYETIRKQSRQQASEGEGPYYQVEPSYERLAGDKGSLWYETVGKTGYETVGKTEGAKERACEDCKQECRCSLHRNKDPGYEKIKDHQYETLKEKDPGYESLKTKTDDPGYDTMTKTPSLQGYETVPPRDKESDVPDILQDIEVSDATASVPPEILALYAQVDKSKKKKNKSSNPSPPPVHVPETLDLNEEMHYAQIQNRDDSLSLSKTDSTDDSFSSEAESNVRKPSLPPRPKGMAPQPPTHLPLSLSNSLSSLGRMSSRDSDSVRNGIKSMEDYNSSSRASSVSGDLTSPNGTLRPLPPIPKQ